MTQTIKPPVKVAPEASKGLVPVAAQETSTALAPEYTGTGSGTSLASLQYLGPKAKGERVEECKSAGVAVHTFYLKDSLGVVPLNPPRIFPIGDQTHVWVVFDDELNMLAAKGYVDGQSAPEPLNGMRWTEHVFGPCLVPNDDDTGLSPVIFSTNGALSRLWKKVNEAQSQCKGEGLGFGGRTPAHKAAVSCPSPIGRFVAKVKGKEVVPQPPKMKYNLGDADILPTTEKQRELVMGYLRAPGIAGLLSVYDRRKADIIKLINKGV